MRKIREERRSVNMDTMIDRKAAAYEQKVKTLANENRDLKQKLAVASKYIDKQNKRIEKLEDSLLNAVTNLGWER